MTKRILSLLLALAMLLCSSLALAEEATLEAPAAKEGEQVVTFWSQRWETWNENWLKTMVYNWNANPDRPFYVECEILDGGDWATRLAAARAAEMAPDVITQSYGALTADYENGYIIDLGDLISEAAWADLNESALDFISVTDANVKVAYPWMLEPAIVMYYDKEAFTSVGLDPESPPTTLEELLEYAEMLTTADRFGLDIDNDWNMQSYIYTFNGENGNEPPLAADGYTANIDNAGMRRLLEFWKTVRTSGIASQTELKHHNSGAYSVLEGRAAMAFSGSWGISSVNIDYPEKVSTIGVAAMPTFNGEPFHATSGGWTFCVDAKSDSKELAAQFIEYALGNQEDPSVVADFFVAAGFCKFTTRKSVADYIATNTAASEDERVQIVQNDIVDYVIAEPSYPYDVNLYIYSMLDKVALEGMDIDEAIAETETLINQFMADKKALDEAAE